MEQAHYDAVKVRLESDSRLDGKVFDSARINEDGTYKRDNYLILLGGLSELGGVRSVRRQIPDDDAAFEFTVEAVSTSPSTARELRAAARALLVDWVPQVEGRRCSKLRFYQGDNPAPIFAVKPPLFRAADEFTLRSHFLPTGS